MTAPATSPVAALDQAPALISVPEAARILGISRASAYRYAAAGELPVKPLGGRIYIITAKLRQMITGEDHGEVA
jgi:predicted site-specific integrase-resolvase